MNKDSVKDQALKLLKYGEKKADHVLVNIDKNISEELEIIRNNINGFDSYEYGHFVVNVWKNGKKGVSYGNRFSLKLVDKALKIAKANKKLDYFYGLPSRQKVVYPDIFDKRILDLGENKFISMANQLIDGIITKEIVLSKATIARQHGFSYTLNSNNVKVGEESTLFSLSASATGNSNGKVSSCWGYKNEPYLFKFNDVIKQVKQECLDFLRAKRLSTDIKNVILKPEPLSDLLNYSFLTNFNAKNIEKKQSCLGGKLGENLFDKNFSLHDNGILKRGINSSSVDFEGSAHRDTCLIKNGVLKGFIYDHNTAKHVSKQSTGNANSTGIGFTNVVLKGKHNKIDEGLIIGSIIGAHTSNPLTTDFSVKAENCYYYKHGEKIPVKGIMLSGKMLDVLNNIISIDKDKKQRNGVYTGSLVSDKINVIRG